MARSRIFWRSSSGGLLLPNSSRSWSLIRIPPLARLLLAHVDRRQITLGCRNALHRVLIERHGNLLLNLLLSREASTIHHVLQSSHEHRRWLLTHDDLIEAIESPWDHGPHPSVMLVLGPRGEHLEATKKLLPLLLILLGLEEPHGIGYRKAHLCRRLIEPAAEHQAHCQITDTRVGKSHCRQCNTAFGLFETTF